MVQRPRLQLRSQSNYPGHNTWGRRNNSSHIAAILNPANYENSEAEFDEIDDYGCCRLHQHEFICPFHKATIQRHRRRKCCCHDYQIKPLMFPHPAKCVCGISNPRSQKVEKFSHFKLNVDEDTMREIESEEKDNFYMRNSKCIDFRDKTMVKKILMNYSNLDINPKNLVESCENCCMEELRRQNPNEPELNVNFINTNYENFSTSVIAEDKTKKSKSPYSNDQTIGFVELFKKNSKIKDKSDQQTSKYLQIKEVKSENSKRNLKITSSKPYAYIPNHGIPKKLKNRTFLEPKSPTKNRDIAKESPKYDFKKRVNEVQVFTANKTYKDNNSPKQNLKKIDNNNNNDSKKNEKKSLHTPSIIKECAGVTQFPTNVLRKNNWANSILTNDEKSIGKIIQNFTIDDGAYNREMKPKTATVSNVTPHAEPHFRRSNSLDNFESKSKENKNNFEIKTKTSKVLQTRNRIQRPKTSFERSRQTVPPRQEPLNKIIKNRYSKNLSRQAKNRSLLEDNEDLNFDTEHKHLEKDSNLVKNDSQINQTSVKKEEKIEADFEEMYFANKRKIENLKHQPDKRMMETPIPDRSFQSNKKIEKNVSRNKFKVSTTEHEDNYRKIPSKFFENCDYPEECTYARKINDKITLETFFEEDQFDDEHQCQNPYQNNVRTHRNFELNSLKQDRNSNIDQFRNQHYFETHNAKKYVDEIPEHVCVHKFKIDDRLFPVPIKSDVFGISRCSICAQPMTSDKTLVENRQKITDLTTKSSNASMPKVINMASSKSRIEISLDEKSRTLLVDEKKKTTKKSFYTNSHALRYQKGVR